MIGQPPPMRRAAVWLTAVAFGLAAAAASAQDAGSRQTRDYVQSAASADQYEILAAEAALTQSTDPEVRAFAMRMRQDHQQLGKALVEAASRSGLKPPEMAMSADQAQLLGALQGVAGHAFDALYLKQQMLAHRSALTVEQLYAKSGDDPNLRQFAGSAIPRITSHGDMASQMATKLGAAS